MLEHTVSHVQFIVQMKNQTEKLNGERQMTAFQLSHLPGRHFTNSDTRTDRQTDEE